MSACKIMDVSTCTLPKAMYEAFNQDKTKHTKKSGFGSDEQYYVADRQITVARYTLAVDRRAKRDGNDQPADFISCL